MNARVLIVEDDEDIARNLRDLLEGEGYMVTCARNGAVALEQLRGSPELPSLIFLDLMMPVMDGYQFRMEQERDPRIAWIPVVLMTADGDIHAKKHKISGQMQISKPVEFYAILAAVQRFAT